MLRAIFAAAVAASMSGCASGDRLTMDRPEGYVSLAPVRTAGIPWSRARAVTVNITEYAFAPNALHLEVGVPYRLVLRNGGDSRHTFVSEPFFKTVAVRRLVIGDKVIDYPYLQLVELPSGASKELQFLPMRRGSFPLRCSVPLHQSFGMEGTITVR
jgi:uncharacterized cupredoxin-like copper-binding protein